jgi:hypothetical protein
VNATPLLSKLLAALAKEHLEAVLIGNAAAAIHGAPVTTLDFDFMFRETPANMRRLKRVAVTLRRHDPPTVLPGVAALPDELPPPQTPRRRKLPVRLAEPRASGSPGSPGLGECGRQAILAPSRGRNRHHARPTTRQPKPPGGGRMGCVVCPLAARATGRELQTLANLPGAGRFA